MKHKNKSLLIISIVFVCIILIVAIIFFAKFKEEEKQKLKQIELEEKIDNVKSHYNKYVITNKKTKLLTKDKDKYIESGQINTGISILLEDIKITADTKYFLISNLNQYIYFEDVNPIDEFEYSDRYKNYIPYNKNIVTKNTTNFYDIDGNFMYTINSSFEFKVIIDDNERYGIEYANNLLFVNQSDVDNVYETDNGQINASRIRTLTYHYIYNQQTNSCTQEICQSFEQLENHLKYIKDNNYFTLTLPELELYLDGKLKIPEKSIVITIDDGSVYDEGASELLEKYGVKATMFLITGRYNDFTKFKSNNLDLESHTDNMHNAGQCAGYGLQGGGILCLPEEQVLSDLKLSQEKLGGSKYFAYPFFDFSDRAISLLKKAGFNMAFIGQYNTDGYSYPNKTDKYKIPRKTIFSSTSMNEFISYLQ